jgi:abhydrolase domain-containing protein 17
LKNATNSYKFIVGELKIDPRKLVVYGQSMGTGPAIFLGANPDYPVAGVITEGAFASGFKLFSKEVRFNFKNFQFRNFDLKFFFTFLMI